MALLFVYGFITQRDPVRALRFAARWPCASLWHTQVSRTGDVNPSRVQSQFFRGGLSRARSLPTAPLAVAAAVVVAVVVAVAAAAIASTMATAAVAAAERSPRARRLVVGGRGGSAAAVAAERRPGVERDTRPAWSHFASVVSAGRLAHVPMPVASAHDAGHGGH